MIHRIRIKKHEIGLRFYRGEFTRLLGPGTHWTFGRVTVKVVSGRDVYLRHDQLDLVVKSRLGAAMALLLPAEAWKAHGKRHPLGDEHKGFIDIVPPRVTDEQLDQAMRDVTPEMIDEALFAGSPDEICEQVRPLVDAGARHLIISNGGAALTGGKPIDIVRLGSLMRKLRRL